MTTATRALLSVHISADSREVKDHDKPFQVATVTLLSGCGADVKGIELDIESVASWNPTLTVGCVCMLVVPLWCDLGCCSRTVVQLYKSCGGEPPPLLMSSVTVLPVACRPWSGPHSRPSHMRVTTLFKRGSSNPLSPSPCDATPAKLPLTDL